MGGKETLMEQAFLKILDEQDEIASKLLRWQEIFRKAVQDKNWAKLMSSSAQIDSLTEAFNECEKRSSIYKTDDGDFTIEESKKIGEIKRKLLKVQIENKAISDYIKITRDFVRKLIDTALPQSRPKIYTRRGYGNTQPQSIVVNALM